MLAAAAEVFAGSGYANSSLDDVAAAAGFSKGAVYSNFESKQELLLVLIRKEIELRVESVREATKSDVALTEVSTRAGSIVATLSEAQPHWNLLFIEFWLNAVRDPGIRGELAEARRSMRVLIADFIDEQADRLGLTLPLPSQDLATIVLALSNGLVIEHLADQEEVSPDLFGPALQLVLGGISASNEDELA